jgi:peptidoglycan/xylan/chitin deacetylase (PgdA/CDA1 family)
LSRLPILTFHALDDGSDVLAFPPAALAGGLDRLLARGWRSLPLLDVAGDLAAGRPLPTRAFVLTFDDAYFSVYERAVPLLVERRLAATVFVTSGDGGGERPPSPSGRATISWRELDELVRHGVAIGAHSRTHPDLTTLSAAAARAEMAGSRAVLEDRLGVAVRSFAYPFGRFDGRCRELASELFDCACTDRLGRVGPRSDRFALPRVEMFYLRGARRLTLLGTPLIGPLLTLLAGRRRLRRALAGRLRG